MVYDATNLTRKDRRRILKDLPPGVKRLCVYLQTPAYVAMARNPGRSRVVPEEVIRRMYDKFEEPKLDEGWDEIRVIHP